MFLTISSPLGIGPNHFSARLNAFDAFIFPAITGLLFAALRNLYISQVVVDLPFVPVIPIVGEFFQWVGGFVNDIQEGAATLKSIGR